MNNCVNVEDIPLNEWNSIFAINLTTAYILSKNFKNNLLKSNASIVFVSSIVI